MASEQQSLPVRSPTPLGPPVRSRSRLPFRVEDNPGHQYQLGFEFDTWVEDAQTLFHQLILFGEGQPSNGLVRKVECPDGMTNFIVAYGSPPDRDLQALLGIIYVRLGAVVLLHDGRDSTGKHWIACYSNYKTGPSERPFRKATICVLSKNEFATIPHPKAEDDSVKGQKKKKTSDEEGEWPPKVPGAVSWAPGYLFLLPWHKQLQWLEPAAAQALRTRMEAEFAWGESSSGMLDGIRNSYNGGANGV